MNIAFFDIDGTLANGKIVPESAAKALRQLRQHNTIIFICTGRALPYVRKNFYQYANGFISNNGRYAVMGCCEVMYDQPIESSKIAKIRQVIKDTGAGGAFFTTTSGYYEGPEEGFSIMSEVWDPGFLKQGVPENQSFYSLDVYFQNDTVKKKLEIGFQGLALMNGHGPHPTADVTVFGSDKAAALRSVAAHLNVPIENTYAFGDGINDLSMLIAAGHGIAMGNAVDAVKEQADYVTTDINDDGVKNGLLHYGLIDEEEQ